MVKKRHWEIKSQCLFLLEKFKTLSGYEVLLHEGQCKQGFGDAVTNIEILFLYVV